MKRKWLLILAIMVVVCWAAVAGANTVLPTPTGTLWSTITVDNTILTGPFADLYLAVAGNLATFEIVARPSFAFTDVFLNLTNTAVTYNKVFWDGAATFTPGPPPGNGNVDGFGDFNYSLNANPTGTDGAGTFFKFTLALASGTWANIDSVLMGNPNYFEAVHIFGGPSLGITGFAAQPVPIPPSALLLGSGLLGLGLVGWRRKKG